MRNLLSILLLLLCLSLSAQIFIEKPYGPNANGVFDSSISFGDIDGDNDLDMVFIGNIDPGASSGIYLNVDNEFVVSDENIFEPLTSGSVQTFDSDNDGDLDVLFTGSNAISVPTADLYFNNGDGTFIKSVNPDLVGVQFSSSAVDDVDNDGDLDFIILGFDGNTATTNLYLNDGNGQYSISPNNNFIPADDGSLAFADVDDDGDNDVIISGWDVQSIPRTNLYINNGEGVFSLESNSQFGGVLRSSILPLDVDADLDLDFIISGATAGAHTTRVYINNSGIFTEQVSPFADIANGDLKASDVDLDGDLDVLLSGNEFNSIIAQSVLYMNDGSGGFEQSPSEIIDGFILGQSEFVDYDQDGDQDLFIIGLNQDLLAINKLYENNSVLSSNNNLSHSETVDFKAFPNRIQVGQKIILDVEINKSAKSQIQIFDVQGKMYGVMPLDLKEGNFKYSIDAPLDSGEYFINLNSDNFNATVKITVLN